MPMLSTTDIYEVEPQSSSTAPGQPTTSSVTNSPSQTVSANPSLILAFLALSFFTMAMVFIFGFRRYQYIHERLNEVFGAHPDRHPEQQAAEQFALRRSPGTKPNLWEVCTDASARWWEVKTSGRTGNWKDKDGDKDAMWNWRNIMPLSATTFANTDELGIVPSIHPASPNPTSSNVFQRFCRFRATTSPSNSRHSKSMTALSPMSRLRVSVLVAMPSERHPVYDRLRADKSKHQRGTAGYELGFFELPWDTDDDT